MTRRHALVLIASVAALALPTPIPSTTLGRRASIADMEALGLIEPVGIHDAFNDATYHQTYFGLERD